MYHIEIERKETTVGGGEHSRDRLRNFPSSSNVINFATKKKKNETEMVRFKLNVSLIINP